MVLHQGCRRTGWLVFGWLVLWIGQFLGAQEPVIWNVKTNSLELNKYFSVAVVDVASPDYRTGLPSNITVQSWNGGA